MKNFYKYLTGITIVFYWNASLNDRDGGNYNDLIEEAS